MSQFRSNPDLARAALGLSLFTVGYNIVEGVVSVLFAVRAGSTALLGFGVDSFVESLSGAVMVWRFWHPHGAEREQRAAQAAGVSLLALAAYVLYEAAASLWTNEPPQRSLAAIVIAVVSLAVMPTLFVAKRRVALSVGSRSLLVDSRQTLACSLLSVALLVGAGAHYWLGWWRADSIAGVVIAVYLLKEGWDALTTRELCCC